MKKLQKKLITAMQKKSKGKKPEQEAEEPVEKREVSKELQKRIVDELEKQGDFQIPDNDDKVCEVL